jgi:cation diffusion facilitator CzcD-associated flavoprotein CzcO
MDQAVHDLPAPPMAARRNRAGLRVAIMGAGFGGIGLAILLRKAGFTALTLFERKGDIGGTWRDNSYWGAACDVQSHLYSFSFAPRAEWTQRYSGQAEILAYIQGVAREHGITPLVRLNTEVVGADYDAARAVWQVRTAANAVEEFDIFIPAVGQLSRPVIPAFEGLADFAGARFHSAAWDHGVELAGKSVALVGSAASAVQILPELAKVCGHVDVYQRTPNWLVPRGNGHYPAWRKALFKHVPIYRQALRLYLYLYGEFLYDAFRTGSWRNTLLKNAALKHLHTQVPDPALRAKLTPSYELGCKRVLFSDDFFPCFARPNVSLVTDKIERFEAAGLRTADGVLHPADVAIFATGFDVTNCLSPIAIHGRDGAQLEALWKDGPFAYRGVAVPGFPNMLIMYGPNTNLGHNSIIVMLEAQARYIVQCLSHMVERNLTTLEVSQGACRLWNERVQRELGQMVWTTGCGSWYESAGGRITANWSGSTLEYRRVMKSPVFSDFTETVAA